MTPAHDARALLLSLLAPRAVGDEILPGVRLDGASTELGLRFRFTTDEGVLWVDVAPASHMERAAAHTARLGLAYRTEGGKSRVPPETGLALCRELASVVAANEERVLREAKTDGSEESTRVRRVAVDGILELTGPEGETFYTLSPYVGCLIGCRFCYAQTKVAAIREVLGLPVVPWGSYVDVRANAPEVLARELAALLPRPIKFCPVVSDPYQAIEARERVTRGCLEAIAKASRPWPVLLLTRSTLVLDDADLLASLPVVLAGVSMPTIDDEVRAHFEPRAASVDERLDVLRRLRAAGVRTLAVVQPILEGSLVALADALAETVESVSIDVLRGTVGAAADFDDPRYAHTVDPGWQSARSDELEALLTSRGVTVWRSELPPGL